MLCPGPEPGQEDAWVRPTHCCQESGRAHPGKWPSLRRGDAESDAQGLPLPAVADDTEASVVGHEMNDASVAPHHRTRIALTAAAKSRLQKTVVYWFLKILQYHY